MIDKQTNKWADRQKQTKTSRQTGRQTDRQTKRSRPTDRQTDRLRDRQTDRTARQMDNPLPLVSQELVPKEPSSKQRAVSLFVLSNYRH